MTLQATWIIQRNFWNIQRKMTPYIFSKFKTQKDKLWPFNGMHWIPVIYTELLTPILTQSMSGICHLSLLQCDIMSWHVMTWRHDKWRMMEIIYVNMGVKSSVWIPGIQPLALKSHNLSFWVLNFENRYRVIFLCIFQKFLCIIQVAWRVI